MTLLAVVLMTTSSFGQIMSYLSSLKISDSGIAVAEMSLMHRSRSNVKDIRDLGSRLIMIPGELNGQQLKIESNRFRTSEGTAFEMNGITYVPVRLFYDNETTDPRDDIFILSLPFSVETELVLEELSHNQGEELITSNFKQAPKGKATYEVNEIEVIKLE